MPKPKRTPPPPKEWNVFAKKFWASVHRQFAIEEPQHVELLRAACQQLHRAEQARAVVDEEGAVDRDRFGQRREHPGVATERKAHLAFLRISRELGLDVEITAARGPRRPGTGA